MKFLKAVTIIFLLFISLSAESQTKFITKEKAISISKKYKSYNENKTNLILDSIKKIWIVTRLDSTYHSKKGNCKFTNGCTVQLTTVLKLGAISGKFISKKKKVERFANYE